MNTIRYAGNFPSPAAQASPVSPEKAMPPATMPQNDGDAVKFSGFPHYSPDVTTAIGAVGAAGTAGLIWLQKLVNSAKLDKATALLEKIANFTTQHHPALPASANGAEAAKAVVKP
jgi:hypothetical protein